jgi:hypothetical protein
MEMKIARLHTKKNHGKLVLIDINSPASLTEDFYEGIHDFSDQKFSSSSRVLEPDKK